MTCGTITSILFQTPVATPAPRPSVKERKKGPKAPSPQVSGSSPETITLSSDEDEQISSPEGLRFGALHGAPSSPPSPPFVRRVSLFSS